MGNTKMATEKHDANSNSHWVTKKWNWLGHMRRENDERSAKQTPECTPEGHRGRGTEEHLAKRSGERKVDSRFQVQLVEDVGDSTGQSWMDKVKWCVAYGPPRLTKHESSKSNHLL